MRSNMKNMMKINERGQFIKGHISWNKGKHLPDWIKKKLSLAHTKHFKSECFYLTKPLAYLLGAIEGDGHIDKHGRIKIAVTDYDFIREIKTCFDTQFGTDIRIGRTSPNLYRIEFCSIEVASFFNAFDFNSLNINFIPSFLKGLFDAEGSVKVRFNGKYLCSTIRLGNTDFNLLQLTQRFLEILGIKSFIVMQYFRHKVYKNSKPYYTLEIRRFRDMLLFKNNINFIIQRKSSKLEIMEGYCKKMNR